MPRFAVISSRRGRLAAGIVGLCAGVARAHGQVRLASADGDTLRIGYLLQARGEWTRSNGAATAQNLFVRHLRVLAAGRVFRDVTFFAGSDAPNIGKTLPDGTKNKPWMTIYDAWATYEASDEFKMDMGLIGTPNSHNSIQSISGMLGPDFGPYSFVSTPPSGEKAGRDYAAQARGYLFDGHVEYRAGAFTSVQSPVAGRRPRYLARLVVDLDRAERTVYYSGTTLGAQRHIAFGVSVDHQDDYNAFGGDVYVDRALPNGDAISLQTDVVRYDGGATFPTLAPQTTSLVEAGYVFRRLRLAPFVQVAIQAFSADADRDQNQTLLGAAYFLRGHSLNVKAALGRSRASFGRTSSLAQLTVQAFGY